MIVLEEYPSGRSTIVSATPRDPIRLKEWLTYVVWRVAELHRALLSGNTDEVRKLFVASDKEMHTAYDWQGAGLR